MINEDDILDVEPDYEAELLKIADEYGSSVFEMTIPQSSRIHRRLLKAVTNYARSRHPDKIWGFSASVQRSTGP